MNEDFFQSKSKNPPEKVWQLLMAVPGDSGQQGKQFSRSEGGEDIVFKHRDLFVIGMFESGYHPVLNIRYRYLPRNMKII